MKVLIQFFFLYSLPIINHTVHNLCNDLIIMKFYFVLFLSEDFGDVVADVNYLNAGGAAPDYKIFICWHPSEGIKASIWLFPLMTISTLSNNIILPSYRIWFLFYFSFFFMGLRHQFYMNCLMKIIWGLEYKEILEAYTKRSTRRWYPKKGFYLIRPFSL